MPRRSWLVAALLGLAGVAGAQSPKNALRPEALLPEETILFVGTDDVEAMVAKARSSPVGKILAEQEMKDFLEKPVAEIRTALDHAMAAAKQHPALAQVELDLDKVLAGPYGRAFLAVTHVRLPAPEAFDPSAIEIGLVIGLEPRAGAVDVVGLLRQIIGALAESEGGGAVKVETIALDGLSYDRIQAPGGAPPLCFANVGGLRLITLSERALADIAGRAKSGGASLLSNGAYARSVAATGAPAAGDLVVFLEIGKMMDLFHQGISLGMTMGGETEKLAIVDKLFERSKLSALGPVYATSTWRDGVAVTAGYSEVDPSVGGICALVSPKPIDRNALKSIPKDALSFSLASIEIAPLWDIVMDGLKDAAPEIHEQVASAIRGFETQAAGADAAGNPNWDIRRDLIGALAGRTTSVSTPGAASMLGPGGDLVFSMETPRAESLDKSLKYLFAAAGQMMGNPITFKEQVLPLWTFGPNGVDDGGSGDDVHEDAKLQVLDTMSLGQAAMLAGSLQITYTIHGGRFWFSTSTKALKKTLAALNTPPAENITAKADFASHFVEPPKGAVLTGLSYGDTAANFENGYTQILGVIPMLMMGVQQGGMGDLPIDMSLLPTAETISKHLFGTVSLTYDVGDHGHVSITRGPFGAETGLVVVAGAAAVGGLMAVRAETANAQRRAARPGGEKPAGGDPADQARRTIAELNTGITIYMIEFGKAPATLDAIVKPTADYPSGMLNGATELPTDPWGHAYAYKTDGAESYTVWSFGPNGVDDGGEGDDIVQRS